jgi:hypothetical protein
VLAELRRLGEAEDPPAKRRVKSREQELGHKVWGQERSDLYGGAPLSITPEVGELLYALALTRRARTIVEFGASLGFSTIHLAAALSDLGAGTLITTEPEPDKPRSALQNLADAGLGDVVELRIGDASITLPDLTAGPLTPRPRQAPAPRATDEIEDQARAGHRQNQARSGVPPDQPDEDARDDVSGQPQHGRLEQGHRIGARQRQPRQRPDDQA